MNDPRWRKVAVLFEFTARRCEKWFKFRSAVGDLTISTDTSMNKTFFRTMSYWSDLLSDSWDGTSGWFATFRFYETTSSCCSSSSYQLVDRLYCPKRRPVCSVISHYSPWFIVNAHTTITSGLLHLSLRQHTLPCLLIKFVFFPFFFLNLSAFMNNNKPFIRTKLMSTQQVAHLFFFITSTTRQILTKAQSTLESVPS